MSRNPVYPVVVRTNDLQITMGLAHIPRQGEFILYRGARIIVSGVTHVAPSNDWEPVAEILGTVTNPATGKPEEPKEPEDGEA